MDTCQGVYMSSKHEIVLHLMAQNTLLHPDERQLTRGIKATDVPVHLQSMVDSLVWESARTEEGYEIHKLTVTAPQTILLVLLVAASNTYSRMVRIHLVNPFRTRYRTDLHDLDVLGTLVKLSESDRPFGIQAEVLRAVQNMVVLLDETFLVHSAVHKAVLRLLRNCVGDDIQEQLDGRNKAMGAAGNAVRSQPSEYEEDRK